MKNVWLEGDGRLDRVIDRFTEMFVTKEWDQAVDNRYHPLIVDYLASELYKDVMGSPGVDPLFVCQMRAPSYMA